MVGTFSEYALALLPEIVLTVAACLGLFLGVASKSGRRSLAAPFSLVAIAAVLFLSVWFDADTRTSREFEMISGLLVGPMSTYVRLITLLVGALLVLVNWHQADPGERGEYFAMVLFSMAGVMLVAAANDLILLFFALELVSVPTYIMIAISRKDIRAQEASSKYFFLGAMAAAMTAYGLSFLYGVTGTTTMFGQPTAGGNSIAAVLASGQVQQLYVMVGVLLTFGGICFKIAAVPLHAYVADVYQGAASPLAGLLAFVPKLGGFVALIQLLGILSWDYSPNMCLWWAIWIVAAATMTLGNVLALMQSNIKRLLAYSSIAHSGYMLIGLLVGPKVGEGPFGDGISALLFYVAIYGVMTLGAFAILACLSTDETEVEEQDQIAGLSKNRPWAALGLSICMFSLMGLPPTAGFLGKIYIFSSAFSVGSEASYGQPLIWLAVIGVLNSAVGAAYYLRVVGCCYLRPPAELSPAPKRFGVQLGATICALLLLAMFLVPQSLLRQSDSATSDLPRAPGAPLSDLAQREPGTSP